MQSVPFARQFLCLVAALLVLPNLAAEARDLESLRLPPGFRIAYYAEDVRNARSLELTPNGTLFVSTRNDGRVYALRDTNGDNQADEVFLIAQGKFMPNGIAFRDGSLYVAEVNRISRYDDIENRLADPPEPVVVFDDLPSDTHHGWKYMALGPDDKLYFNIGAPCNVCLSENEVYATISRVNPDGTDFEVFAHGVRNSIGFDWHPETGELWFTDNGRDWMGDNRPPDELNHAPEQGLHFGFPHWHGSDDPDPRYGLGYAAEDFVLPVQNLGPHVASLGMRFYTGQMFPDEYRHQVFIAERGSWNRSVPIGYRVTLVRLDENGQALSYEPFVEGWLQGDQAWGRPVDVQVMPDGALLISDDTNNAIYRVWYEPEE